MRKGIKTLALQQWWANLDQQVARRGLHTVRLRPNGRVKLADLQAHAVKHGYSLNIQGENIHVAKARKAA